MSGEPQIVINGIMLSEAQAMTVRVALSQFQMDLKANGLGEDETGKGISAGYLARAHEVQVIMRMPT